MYTTCLHCHHALGRNEVLEAFPVGRRLAFDAATGRLWVVCPDCRRWNLTPLEERWEVIEACERRYRDTRLRVATDNIGLARLREGLELVRVGRPLRPEIAAWRYGAQFARRQRRSALVTGTAAVGGGLLLLGGASLGPLAVLAYKAGEAALQVAPRGFWQGAVARVRDTSGRLHRVRRDQLRRTSLDVGDDGALAVRLALDDGPVTFTGDAAHRAATVLFPAVNRAGGTAADVERAVARLEQAGDSARFLRDLAPTARRLTAPAPAPARWALHRDYWDDDGGPAGLLALPLSIGLAVEMALHEEVERRALEGELAALEAAWREAAEIAAIADDLLLPAMVRELLERLRR